MKFQQGHDICHILQNAVTYSLLCLECVQGCSCRCFLDSLMTMVIIVLTIKYNCCSFEHRTSLLTSHSRPVSKSTSVPHSSFCYPVCVVYWSYRVEEDFLHYSGSRQSTGNRLRFIALREFSCCRSGRVRKRPDLSDSIVLLPCVIRVKTTRRGTTP